MRHALAGHANRRPECCRHCRRPAWLYGYGPRPWGPWCNLCQSWYERNGLRYALATLSRKAASFCQNHNIVHYIQVDMLGVASALDIHNGASATLWCTFLVGGSQFTDAPDFDSDGDSDAYIDDDWDRLLACHISDNILRTFSVAFLPQSWPMCVFERGRGSIKLPYTILNLIVAFLDVFPTAMIPATSARARRKTGAEEGGMGKERGGREQRGREKGRWAWGIGPACALRGDGLGV